MEDIANFGKLHKLFDENFMEYTSYVIKERAIPDMSDGLKPVQRRILQTLYNMDDGRFQKVANVVGETMKLHPQWRCLNFCRSCKPGKQGSPYRAPGELR